MVKKADLISELKALSGQADIRFDVPLDKHTSLGIGGVAAAFSSPENEAALTDVLKAASRCDAKVLVLGGGTNLLIPDTGFDGLVVHVGAFESLSVLSTKADEVIVQAGSGVRMQKLMAYCRQEGYSGLEPLSGIPGMLGGAVAGNAGSFETEIKDLITEIRLAGHDGEIKTIGPAEAGFSYRGSTLLDAGVITGVTLSLKKSTPEEVASRSDEFLKRKQAAQPIGKRSAGCVFKNPEGDFAGRLIDTAGCKGLSVNDIEVSRQHANFFINTGKGNSADFLSLMEKVSKKVFEVHGIRLEPEIRVPEKGARKVPDKGNG